MTKNVSIDSLGLTAVSDSDQPQAMTVYRADGQSTVLQLLVLGKFATAVEKSSAKFYQKYQKTIEANKRKGKKEEAISYEQARRDDLEATMARVAGWQGVDDEYSAEALEKLLIANPHIKGDIVEFSEDVTNFTRTA